MARHRKHRRRRYSNPAHALSVKGLLSGPKEMISTGFIMEAAGVAAGFVLPNVVLNYVPATWKAAKWQFYTAKIATVAALSAAASMVSKRVSRFVLVGGGVSLLLDLYTDFMGHGTAAAAPAAAPGTQAYFGPDLSMYYGDEVEMM